MPLEFSAIEFEYCGSLELLEEFFHKYINIRSCQLLRINPKRRSGIALWQQGRIAGKPGICRFAASSDQGNRKCRNADH